MRAFHILLKDDGTGASERVDFEADSRDFALIIAQGHAAGRNIELWEGSAHVGSLHRSAPQLWRLT
ncbi:MAG: hypothetical protein J0H88_01375 [Sphingomonadales bacterium]|nr:hypothetical protein [Sphingomonadales bacterium]